MTADPATVPGGGGSRELSGESLVLGVDGGGTKTVAWLATRDAGGSSGPLAVGQAGSGNPRAAGFDAAQANIVAAISAAFHAARMSVQPVAKACLGLAGAGRLEEQERLRAWALDVGLARDVLVTHDAEIILAAGVGASVGVALICGTGSLAWGRNAAGHDGRTGGWGYLLGDEGSAYAIAIAGLRAAVRCADGRDPPTALLPAMLGRLGLSSPTELVGRIYNPASTRERVAELASIVFESAAGGDNAATSIVRSATTELGEMVVALVRQLGFTDLSYPLALAGGVMLQQPGLREGILGHLREAGLRPLGCEVVINPARGAVTLARQVGDLQPGQFGRNG